MKRIKKIIEQRERRKRRTRPKIFFFVKVCLPAGRQALFVDDYVVVVPTPATFLPALRLTTSSE